MNVAKMELRPFIPEDQERILQILTDRTVNKTYMLPDFERKEDAIPLFNRLMELSANSSRYVRCICIESQPVGYLNDAEIKNNSIELGYVIHPDSQNRGYMTMALEQAIAELLGTGYEEVICGAFKENQASIRVMEKCGMIKMEHTDLIEYRGINHRCVYYSKRNG